MTRSFPLHRIIIIIHEIYIYIYIYIYKAAHFLKDETVQPDNFSLVD